MKRDYVIYRYDKFSSAVDLEDHYQLNLGPCKFSSGAASISRYVYLNEESNNSNPFLFLLCTVDS